MYSHIQWIGPITPKGLRQSRIDIQMNTDDAPASAQGIWLER